MTSVHSYIEYASGRPFHWFPEEVSSARCDGDNDPAKKQLGDTFKLKGNSFYGKMIENLARHVRTSFTCSEEKVDEAFRSPFFEDLEEINSAFEIRMHKPELPSRDLTNVA